MSSDESELSLDLYITKLERKQSLFLLIESSSTAKAVVVSKGQKIMLKLP